MSSSMRTAVLKSGFHGRRAVLLMGERNVMEGRDKALTCEVDPEGCLCVSLEVVWSLLELQGVVDAMSELRQPWRFDSKRGANPIPDSRDWFF